MEEISKVNTGKIQIGAVTVTFDQMMAWCRYLYWADLMRQHAESLYDQDATEKEDHFERWFPLMAHWYATLYVVVEGWMELGFRDPIIDKLLAHKAGYKDLLRRYRNGVFHYQPNIIEGRFLEFMKHTEEYVFWPNALNGEFVRFFYDWLNAFQGSDEQTNELRDGVRQIIGGMPENVIDQLERTLIQAERIAGQAEPDSTLQKMAADIGEFANQGREVLAAGKENWLKLRMDTLQRVLDS